MNKPAEAAARGRLYTGYIICAREVTAALDCAMEVAEAAGAEPYILEKPVMENIRELQLRLREDMQRSGTKIGIIYGDKLSERCQNALLKTIEEMDGDIALIFVITNMAVMLPTVISRCVVWYPPAVSEEELMKLTGGNRLAARYAMGSRERARDIMTDKKLTEQRDRAVQIMEQLKKGLPYGAGKSEKDDLNSYLMYMELFLRDAMTGDIYWFFDKRDAVISYINRFTTEEIIVMIKEVKNGLIRINKNTNPMLVFDRVQLGVLEVINGNSNRCAL